MGLLQVLKRPHRFQSPWAEAQLRQLRNGGPFQQHVKHVKVALPVHLCRNTTLF